MATHLQVANRVAATVLIACLGGSTATRCCAVTPASPEVQAMIKKGLAYLEDAEDDRLGAKCLMALAYLKSKPARPDHPKVKAALEACRQWSRGGGAERIDMYSNGLAIIFLCEADPRGNSNLINHYLGLLKGRQKGHGGWGYNDKPTGDTSQSQYAALSFWEAHNNGFRIEASASEQLASWLMQTQDPTGAWGYQGKVATGSELVEQEAISCSMVAAAMGSSLICADLFGLLTAGGGSQSVGDPIPDALQVAGQKQRQRAPSLRSAKLDRRRLFKAIERGNAWMDKNYVESIGRYNVYYLYSLERYKSFQEVLDGDSPAEPDWYNAGFKYLKGRQQQNGSWSVGCGSGPDTAFAILFLVRSTKQLLKPQPLIDLRVGGRGLPKPSQSVKLVGGELVIQQTEAAVGDLLNMLDDETSDKLDQLADSPTALLVVGEVDEAAAQRLRQIVRSGSPAARLVATRTLARTGDLDQAPTLIYALTDPDRKVVIQARDGLRFISRRFEGFGLKESYDEKQRYAAVSQWREWYLSIRPDATVPLN